MALRPRSRRRLFSVPLPLHSQLASPTPVLFHFPAFRSAPLQSSRTQQGETSDHSAAKPGGSSGLKKKKSAFNADLDSTSESEDPLQKEMATHASILAWRIPIDREAWRDTVAKNRTQLSRQSHQHRPASSCPAPSAGHLLPLPVSV